MTLTEFLLARIVEDEARATLVLDSPPKWTMTVYPHDGEGVTLEAGPMHPARVLAECEAKRRNVDHFTSSAPGGDGEAETYWFEGFRSAMEFVLWKMAQPYADHPDYREEWRP